MLKSAVNGGWPLDKIEMLDTTLRDGAQGEGISFSVEDKISIVQALDDLGIDLIEAGNPGSNPKDEAFFERMRGRRLGSSRLVAFGSTMHKGGAAGEDRGLAALAGAGTGVVAVFGKAWDFHVEMVLETTKAENLRMIAESVRFLTARGKEVLFDAEHFFDGYRENRQYALDCLRAAVGAGAARVVLCDTNGGCFPSEIAEVIRAVAAAVDAPLGLHCHDDCGMAVAASISGVEAGVRHVQGTLLGFGERCGNACLATIIPTLQLKRRYRCIPADRLQLLTPKARQVAELSNTSIKRNAPYIGNSAFAHKAGMHAAGVVKTADSFEHISPEQVGNERRLLISEMAGRAAVLRKIQALAPDLRRDSPDIARIIERLKRLESEGYQFEGAESSLELLIRKALNQYEPFFELVRFQSMSTYPDAGEPGAAVSAMVKVRVGGEEAITAAEGVGPVDALDKALRKALERFYPCLQRVHLIDYKVRVIDSEAATAARVRVLITSSDGARVWTTVGVSVDIIQASLTALVDSIEYRLLRQEEA